MKYDKNDDVSYALGTTLVFELLLRKKEVATKIYINPKQKRDDTYSKLEKLAHEAHIPFITNNQKIFSLSDKGNTMVIGEFKKFSSPIKKGNHLILVNPSDKGNLGTIIRSASAFGIDFLAIIRPAADAFDPKTVRSSMGAIFSVPFAYYDSFDDYLKEAGEMNLYPFMLKAKTPLKGTQFKKPYGLIFGNEATGLDDSYLKIGTPIKIEQTDMVDSLNLDNAVSIGLYVSTLY